MYKYSKKAEERFFTNPCMAFLFIKFSENPQAREQVMNKLLKQGASDEDTEMKDEVHYDQNVRQVEVNERILCEIDHMRHEASKVLFKTFLKRVEQIATQNLYMIHQFSNLSQYSQVILKKCQDTDITIHLLDFLNIK
jgi:hypothetical protein